MSEIPHQCDQCDREFDWFPVMWTRNYITKYFCTEKCADDFQAGRARSGRDQR